MMPIGEGTSIPTTFALEYVFVAFTLAVVSIVTCDTPIGFELRRLLKAATPLNDAINGIVSLLFDACRRTIRSIGDHLRTFLI
jgi:hypothetical protein